MNRLIYMCDIYTCITRVEYNNLIGTQQHSINIDGSTLDCIMCLILVHITSFYLVKTVHVLVKHDSYI